MAAPQHRSRPRPAEQAPHLRPSRQPPAARPCCLQVQADRLLSNQRLQCHPVHWQPPARLRCPASWLLLSLPTPPTGAPTSSRPWPLRGRLLWRALCRRLRRAPQLQCSQALPFPLLLLGQRLLLAASRTGQAQALQLPQQSPARRQHQQGQLPRHKHKAACTASCPQQQPCHSLAHCCTGQVLLLLRHSAFRAPRLQLRSVQLRAGPPHQLLLPPMQLAVHLRQPPLFCQHRCLSQSPQTSVAQPGSSSMSLSRPLLLVPPRRLDPGSPRPAPAACQEPPWRLQQGQLPSLH